MLHACCCSMLSSSCGRLGSSADIGCLRDASVRFSLRAVARRLLDERDAEFGWGRRRVALVVIQFWCSAILVARRALTAARNAAAACAVAIAPPTAAAAASTAVTTTAAIITAATRAAIIASATAAAATVAATSFASGFGGRHADQCALAKRQAFQRPR